MKTIVVDSVAGAISASFNLDSILGINPNGDPDHSAVLVNLAYEQGDGSAAPARILVVLQHPDGVATHIYRVFDSAGVPIAVENFQKLGCNIPVPRFNPGLSNTNQDGIGLSWTLDVSVTGITAPSGSFEFSAQKMNLQNR